MDKLIRAGANVKEETENRMTALMFAARGGQYKCLKTLISDGNVHVDVHDKYRETALIHAARSYSDVSEDNCIDLLLEKGADVNLQDDQCKTALMIAAENGHSEKTRLLLQ